MQEVKRDHQGVVKCVGEKGGVPTFVKARVELIQAIGHGRGVVEI